MQQYTKKKTQENKAKTSAAFSIKQKLKLNAKSAI